MPAEIPYVTLLLTLMDDTSEILVLLAPEAARYLAYSPERGVRVKSAKIIIGDLHNWGVGYGKDIQTDV